MTVVVEWGRREACSKPRDYFYFITKVSGRKETETKINLDSGVFYELLNEVYVANAYVCPSICLWSDISNTTVCTVAIKFSKKVSHYEAVDQVRASSKLSQWSSHFTKRSK
jgi:hypothetical protein